MVEGAIYYSITTLFPMRKLLFIKEDHVGFGPFKFENLETGEKFGLYNDELGKLYTDDADHAAILKGMLQNEFDRNIAAHKNLYVTTKVAALMHDTLLFNHKDDPEVVKL